MTAMSCVGHFQMGAALKRMDNRSPDLLEQNSRSIAQFSNNEYKKYGLTHGEIEV